MKLTQIKPNLHRVDLGRHTVYFSYETPIAFYDDIMERIIMSENVWTRTTGRHLGLIKKEPDRFLQVPHEEFLERLSDY